MNDEPYAGTSKNLFHSMPYNHYTFKDATVPMMPSNFVSTLSVSATSTVPNAVLVYTLDSGTIPNGITLGINGQLQGKIRQFGTTELPGLTTIDKATLEFIQNSS